MAPPKRKHQGSNIGGATTPAPNTKTADERQLYLTRLRFHQAAWDSDKPLSNLKKNYSKAFKEFREKNNLVGDVNDSMAVKHFNASQRNYYDEAIRNWGANETITPADTPVPEDTQVEAPVQDIADPIEEIDIADEDAERIDTPVSNVSLYLEALHNSSDPFGLLNQQVQDVPMSATMAGIAGGGPAAQIGTGCIKKNKPQYADDGSSVTFSGSRMMYTWGYNFSEQVNPYSLNRKLVYNSNGDQVFKPLGQTVPWDWIPFYCTPAEWESLQWGSHIISVEEVGIRITPIDKSVFFTTGSTTSTPVTTEHAAYVYKVEDFDSGTHLLSAQAMQGNTPLDWGAANVLAPLNYSRLRDRLWGTRDRAGIGHSCLDGVKRELEPILGVMLDNTAVYTDFGSFLLGEKQEVYSLLDVMGKPFIQKSFKPVNGLVSDPRVKVLSTHLHDGVMPNNAPYFSKQIYEDQLREASILASKQIDHCYLYDDTVNGSEHPVNSANFPPHGGNRDVEITQQNNVFAEVPLTNTATRLNTDPFTKIKSGGGTLVLENDFGKDGTIRANRYPIVAGQLQATGTPGILKQSGSPITNPAATAHINIQDENGYMRMYPKLVIDTPTAVAVENNPSGAYLLGNAGGRIEMFQTGTEHFQGEGPLNHYTNWAQLSELAHDLDVDHDGDTYKNQSLQTWHAMIEKGNSFLPMGADRDNFPSVIPEQPKFAFGLKPVIATDPNSGAIDFLKAQVNWKIEYFMKIKQTYVKPDLRWTERRTSPSNAFKLGLNVLPKHADYTIGVRDYGLILKNKMQGKFDGDEQILASISDLNPLQRQYTVDGKLMQTIRTANVYHPDDFRAYPDSLQSDLTWTPDVIFNQKFK